MHDHTKAPFPWFGGKSRAAEAVWAALGDVAHYVEPFAGSLAVLLRRPHLANRPYHSETVNDADALLVNAWRSIRAAPDEVALHASWPVTESDKHARQVALVRWREEGAADRIAGDAEFFDARMAGWWLWGIACQIGSYWCSGDGAWWPDEQGRLVKRQREPGIERSLPDVSSDGRGVSSAALREPGIWRGRPHISTGGRGVNAPQLREPGIGEYHDLVMPKLTDWMRALSARLRHVRVVIGDWRRVCTEGAMRTLPCRHGQGGICGVFLDPPYADTAGRTDGVYAVDSLTVAHDVREWALANGDKDWLRIVMAGFDGEHGDAFARAGWREVEWFAGGGMLTGGLGSQQHRERLWLSPTCLGREQALGPLFDGAHA